MLVGLATIAPIYAQRTNAPKDGLNLHRVEAGVGIYTSKDLFSSFQYNNTVVWGSNSNPATFLSLNIFKQRKIEIGIGFGYQKAYLEDDRFINVWPTFPEDESITQTVDYYTILPQIRLNWFQSADGVFELYSGAALAITLVSEKYSNGEGDTFYPIPGLHITGMGVRMGKKIGGFIEMGAGSKGLMSAGLSYRL